MNEQRIKQLREWARLFEGGAWVHRGINDLADELEAERERVRQREQELFTLRNLIFVLEDSATDMGAEYLLDPEKYERLLDVAREAGEPEAEEGEGGLG